MKLYHKTYGEGDPVIILHGLFGMSDNWVSFAKKLAADYMVILVDLRDHGRSPHTSEFSYPLIVEDIAQFMEDNWIYEASIIGHSLGGKAAMQFCIDYDDLVNKLVVVDIGPGEYSGGHELIFESLSSIDLSQSKDRSEFEKILMESIGNIRIVRFLMKNLSREKKGGFQWKMNLPLLKNSYPNILSGLKIDNPIEVPGLFIKGSDSDYLDQRNQKLITEYFSNYRIEEIDKAGHWVHVDQPDVLFKTIYDFLK